MYQEDVYEDIFDRYISLRDAFIKDKWLPYSSIFKRSIGKVDEFKRLRQNDLKFQEVFNKYLKEYLSGYFTESNVDNIKEFKKYLKTVENHSLRLKWRYSFLQAILGLMLFVFFQVGIYQAIMARPNLTHSVIECVIGFIGLSCIGGIIILVFSEQIKLKEYESTYKELNNVLTEFIEHENG